MIQPASNVPVWIIAVVAVLFFLRAATGLMIPIAVAVLLSYALAPVVNWLEHRHIPKFAGAALVILLVIGLCASGAYAVRGDVTNLTAQVPRAVERVREALRSQFGTGAAIGEVIGTTDNQRGSVDRSGEDRSGPLEQMTNSLVPVTAEALLAFAGHLVVVVFLIYFLLISGHHVRNRVVEIAGAEAERRRIASTIIDDINMQIQRYLLVLLVTALVVGVATWLVLAWMRVEQAAMWGILAGVFNSIPYFGPVIVSGGLFVVGLAQSGGTTQAFQMSGAAIVITSIEGWLLTPALMGKAERMSALAVFLGLLLWTWVWGAWGTLLAVPMLVVIKSVADHVDALRPLGRLMAP